MTDTKLHEVLGPLAAAEGEDVDGYLLKCGYRRFALAAPDEGRAPNAEALVQAFRDAVANAALCPGSLGGCWRGPLHQIAVDTAQAAVLAAMRAPASPDPEPRTWDRRAADALAVEVEKLIERNVIDSRSPAADALLDYRDGKIQGPHLPAASLDPEGTRGDPSCLHSFDGDDPEHCQWCGCTRDWRPASPPSPAPRQVQSPNGQEEAMHDGARESRATPPAPSPAPEPAGTCATHNKKWIEGTPCPKCGGKRYWHSGMGSTTTDEHQKCLGTCGMERYVDGIDA